jgi:hypothetical protein
MYTLLKKSQACRRPELCGGNGKFHLPTARYMLMTDFPMYLHYVDGGIFRHQHRSGLRHTWFFLTVYSVQQNVLSRAPALRNKLYKACVREFLNTSNYTFNNQTKTHFKINQRYTKLRKLLSCF